MDSRTGGLAEAQASSRERLAESVACLVRAVHPDRRPDDRHRRSRHSHAAGGAHPLAPRDHATRNSAVLHGWAFVSVYALLGLPIARLADRGSRRLIIGIGMAFWSVMTALCGFANSFVAVLRGARRCGSRGVGLCAGGVFDSAGLVSTGEAAAGFRHHGHWICLRHELRGDPGAALLLFVEHSQHGGFIRAHVQRARARGRRC